MKAYKGFNNDMTCRGFQYEEGKTYETGEAKLCQSGFHACEDPLDCFGYYAPGKSVFREVELEDVSEERQSADSKVVAKKITIGAEISVAKICDLKFAYVKERTTNENNAEPGKAASAGESGAASAGECGAASAGSYGAASAGYRGAASAGESGAASAGSYGAASAGSYGAASAGESGAASAGESGAASAGYRGAASAGDYGYSVSGGKSATGKQGVAVAKGNGACVKGGLGALLVLAEEKSDSYEIVAWEAAVVDGDTIKADTWYTLKNGEFVEVDNAEN